jgi:hypothetical protein
MPTEINFSFPNNSDSIEKTNQYCSTLYNNIDWRDATLVLNINNKNALKLFQNVTAASLFKDQVINLKIILDFDYMDNRNDFITDLLNTLSACKKLQQLSFSGTVTSVYAVIKQLKLLASHESLQAIKIFDVDKEYSFYCVEAAKQLLDNFSEKTKINTLLFNPIGNINLTKKANVDFQLGLLLAAKQAAGKANHVLNYRYNNLDIFQACLSNELYQQWQNFIAFQQGKGLPDLYHKYTESCEDLTKAHDAEFANPAMLNLAEDNYKKLTLQIADVKKLSASLANITSTNIIYFEKIMYEILKTPEHILSCVLELQSRNSTEELAKLLPEVVTRLIAGEIIEQNPANADLSEFILAEHPENIESLKNSGTSEGLENSGNTEEIKAQQTMNLNLSTANTIKLTLIKLATKFNESIALSPSLFILIDKTLEEYVDPEGGIKYNDSPDKYLTNKSYAPGEFISCLLEKIKLLIADNKANQQTVAQLELMQTSLTQKNAKLEQQAARLQQENNLLKQQYPLISAEAAARISIVIEESAAITHLKVKSNNYIFFSNSFHNHIEPNETTARAAIINQQQAAANQLINEKSCKKLELDELQQREKIEAAAEEDLERIIARRDNPRNCVIM